MMLKDCCMSKANIQHPHHYSRGRHENKEPALFLYCSIEVVTLLLYCSFVLTLPLFTLRTYLRKQDRSWIYA